MKHWLMKSLCGIAAALCWVATAGAFPSAPYFPLNPGNTWTYHFVHGAGTFETWTTDQFPIPVGSASTLAVTFSPGGERDYYTSDGAGIRLHQIFIPNFCNPNQPPNPPNGNLPLVSATERLSPPFVYAPGEISQFPMPVGNQTGSVSVTFSPAFCALQPGSSITYSGDSTAQSFELVTVPAGMFWTVKITASLTITVSLNGAVVGQSVSHRAIWAANGVGVIRELRQDDAKPEDFLELQSTNVIRTKPDDVFPFTNATSVAPGSTVLSNSVTVTGITAGSAVSVTGGLVKINNGTPVSSGTVFNGQTVQLVVTAAGYGGSATANLNVGGVTSSFTAVSIVTPPASAVGLGLSTGAAIGFGKQVTLTATVSGTNPTGQVVFLDNGVNIGSTALSGGQAQFSTSTLAVGAHSITAAYAGDASNAAGSSSGVALTVNAAPGLALNSSRNPAKYTQLVTFTATLSGGASPAGTVQFKDGGVNVGSPVTLSGGQAQLTLDNTAGKAFLLPGLHAIGASYSGDSNNGGVSASTIAQRVPTLRDADGDGKSDVFWLHASGQAYLWQMNGTSIASAGSPASTGDPLWKVAGIGDFDGDGKADVMFRHAVTGNTAIWLMNGAAIASSGSPGSVSDTAWEVQGVGDFDGDGKADLFFRNKDTGAITIWLMNGAAIVGDGSPGAVDVNWTVQGVGDFNGDGKSDILWRHTDGTMLVWLMDGTSIASSGSPANVGPTTATGWLVQGVGDFDGDGKADILWRNDDLGGIIYVWKMNGASIASATAVTGVGTEAAGGWVVKAIGDYDGDGKADVLWKNDTQLGGIVYVWLMNGASIAGADAVTGVADFSWQVQNPK